MIRGIEKSKEKVRKSSTVEVSSFNLHWSPTAYLREFYTDVQPDEIETIAFLVRLGKKIAYPQKILEFGCGPTLHHIFPFVPYASEIHMGDFLESNLEEIRKWIEDEKDAHDWDKFISYTLKCEGRVDPTRKDIENRKQAAREKIVKYVRVDAKKSDPAGRELRETYPVVISCYCADSATNDQGNFTLFIRNIVSLIKPGGLFVLACLRNAKHYRVGSLNFPSANVSEDLLADILKLDFYPGTITIEVRELPDHERQGYTSIILAYATKMDRE